MSEHVHPFHKTEPHTHAEGDAPRFSGKGGMALAHDHARPSEADTIRGPLKAMAEFLDGKGYWHRAEQLRSLAETEVAALERRAEQAEEALGSAEELLDGWEAMDLNGWMARAEQAERERDASEQRTGIIAVDLAEARVRAEQAEAERDASIRHLANLHIPHMHPPTVVGYCRCWLYKDGAAWQSLAATTPGEPQRCYACGSNDPSVRLMQRASHGARRCEGSFHASSAPEEQHHMDM
jgi:hypothetical protein